MMANTYQLNQNSPLYVIGDIHGRLDLLDQLIDAIHRDTDACVSLTVTLGDYIDRGPDSRGVIDRLLTNPFPGDCIALKGNHEALLQAFLDQPETGNYWRQLGGLETLSSFGIPVGPLMTGQQYQQAAEKLRVALSCAQLQFLTSLKTSLTVGRFFLCHAGVRPGVPLDRQSEDDLLWIRDEFLNSEANFGKIVVHGHTPTAQPDFRPNRVNLDTGAFATGRLTCLVAEGETYRTIST
jgi:serine/threonine protein phosphatase 1